MRWGAAVAVFLLAIGVVSAQTVVPTDVLYFKQSPNYCLAFDDGGAGGKTELYADTNCNDTYDGSDFYLSTPSGVAQIGSCPTTGTGYQPQIGVQGSGAPDCMVASDAPPNGISAGGNEMMVTNTAGTQIDSAPRVGYDSVLAGLKVYNAGETNSTTYYTDNNQSRIYYAAAGAPDNPFVLETQFATIEMRPCTDGTCAVDGPQVEIYGALYVDDLITVVGDTEMQSNVRITDGANPADFKVYSMKTEINSTYSLTMAQSGVDYLKLDTGTQSVQMLKSFNAIDGGIISPGVTFQPTDTKTASTTQSQGQGALTQCVTNVDDVGNDNDVVTLLDADECGFSITKNSDATETLQVFPSSGDDLGKGANNSTTVEPGYSLECWATSAGVSWCTQWETTSEAPVGGSGGSASGAPNYTQSFTSQTSVTLTHALGTKNLLVACYNGSDVVIEPDSIDINPSDPWDVVVGFDESQSGRCVVNGLMNAGRYTESFSAQTTVTVTGATHGIGTNMLSVTCYDDTDPRNVVGPDNVTVDDGTNDVVITFFEAETGKCVLQ